VRRRRPRAPAPPGPARATANVCQAASCLSARSDQVLDGLADRVAGAGLADVAVRRVGCLGLCAAGPLVEVPETGRLFERVDPGDLDALVEALATVTPGATPAPAAPFFARQVRVATENSGRVDPEDLDDYRARGGYRALATALHSMTPAEVVDQVLRSGLRGRGGAGYPTGLKWTTVAKAPGAQKYVICNADEGDPGAFMDRSVLESDPHRVLEGMAIAGYAVGASRGYVYCRAEYPLATARLKTAIRLAGRAGLLGDGIADTSFEFQVELRLGAGAFVCGEETALIASVQGGRGTPRPRPPYPAVSGLWQSPTLINNVETLASVAPIVRNGGDWYAGIGTPSSRGTKVFALAGRVVNTGLVEVPMGITLREIVYDIGGGILDGRPFKAVQTGGPSGGCIPAQYLDMPVDYESLAQVGSIMGSGGMIVMDDSSCMTTAPAWWMWPATSWTSAARSPAASASRVGSAPPSCTRCSPRSVRARPPWPTWSSWSGCRTWSSAPACAAWARAPPTRCSRPCATSARSTWPTSRTAPARPGSVPSPTRRWSDERPHPAHRRHRRGRRRRPVDP
jgi:bidirectional [NiFe] hydrogenase diaphorase subunit